MNALVFLGLFNCLAEPASGASKATPEDKAVAFLAGEVPGWRPAHNCFSCHNNGDAARALYAADRQAFAMPAKALEDTTAWLAAPEKWELVKGGAPYSDKVLMRIQFAAGLASAVEAGHVKDRRPLLQAAELVAGEQQTDGSWRVDVGDQIGGATTYGPTLATVQARSVLVRADPKQHRNAIARADEWLRQVEVKTVLDAAAVLLGLENAEDEAALKQRGRCLELIGKGRSKSGGWGPFVSSPPEPFDTALVVLALVRLKDRKELEPLIRSGREFLIATQEKDGGWPATTRPPGGASYAQRISTSAWATLALLATKEK